MTDKTKKLNSEIQFLASLSGCSYQLLEKWLNGQSLPDLANFNAESDDSKSWCDLALADNELAVMGPILDDTIGDWLREKWGDVVCNPAQVRRDLKKIDGDVHLRINSPGGNVWAASQIHTILIEARKNRKVTANIDGLSASASTLVQLAAEDVTISTMASMMIHRATGYAFGNGKTIENYGKFMRKEDARIARLYAEASTLSADEALEKMDEETWLTADEAVELEFCSAINAVETESETEIDDEAAAEILANSSSYTMSLLGLTKS